MKKLFIFIITICAICLGSCTGVKHIKDVITGKAGLTEPFHLFQHYTIYADKKQTVVGGMIYFSHYNQTGERIIPQKVLFNDSEMNNGFYKGSYTSDFNCGESVKKFSENADFISVAEFEPEEKVAKEWDFYVKTESYQTDNIISVYRENGIYGEYKINFEPAMVVNPESLKLSRSKENIIKLQNLINFEANVIEEKDKLKFYILQPDGKSIEQNELKYDASSNSIIMPIESSKKLNIGKATINIESTRIGTIKKPQAVSNYYTISYMDKNCVDVID